MERIPRRTPSRSFTGVLPNHKEDILEKDDFNKLSCRKISDIVYSVTKRPTLRKLCLMSTIQRTNQPKQRSQQQINLHRSNSLPDTTTLGKLKLHFTFNSKKKSELVKTRSVTFHPETICLNAAADNDVEELEDILKNDLIDVNYKNGCGLSMVHHAAASGSFECIQLLIKHGVEVNSMDERGLTPLDLAIRGGYFDCALILIKAGSRVERIVNGLQ